MRGKPYVFWIVNLFLLVTNVVVLAMSLSREVEARPEPPQATVRGDQIQGTIRFDMPATVRNFELLNLDSANQGQLQAELIGRLAGRVDGRVETSWQDPYRTVNGNFRMYFLISWVR